MVTGTKTKQDNVTESRSKIARIVLIFSILAMFLICFAYGVGIFFGDKAKFAETGKYIFASIVPLIASWVGVVLTFYFTKENFDAANDSINKIVDKLPINYALRKIPVRSEMIPKNKISLLVLKEGKGAQGIKLKDDILEKFDKLTWKRLPIIDPNEHPKYIIHRSMIDKYLAQKIQDIIKEKTESVDIKREIEELTLQNLLDDDPQLEQIFKSGFGTVREDASLAEAKIEMEKIPNCQDVFVTKNGTKDEPIIGWITNVIVTKAAELS